MRVVHRVVRDIVRTAPRAAFARGMLVVLAASLGACGEKHEGTTPKPPAGGGTPANPASTADTANDRARLVAAYDKGLDFLATQQKDGVWAVQNHPQVGFTAIAVTPFLTRPGGVRPGDKPMTDKSLTYLAAQLGPDGGIKAEFTSNYETSVVIMALAASKDAKWKPQIDKAAAYVKSLQYTDKGDPSYGGVGYGDDGPRSDVSNTQYALASLEAAGVKKDDPVYQRALTFLSRVQNRKENETPGEPAEWKDAATGAKIVRGNDGGAVYFPGNADHTGYDKRPDGTLVLRSYGSVTYALLRCYHLAGLDPSDGRMKAAANWISAHWDLARNPGMPAEREKNGLYYYYVTIGTTLPLLKMDTIATPDGKKVDWRKELSATLLAAQKPDGSWQNSDPRWLESEAVLATGYALAALGPCIR